MNKIIIKILILFAFQNVYSSVCCQEFKTSPLITCPGNNRNFDVISHQTYFGSIYSYICWENQLDSIYTIYLQQIDPLEQRIIKVISDTIPNINPQVARVYQDNSIMVLWQSLIDNHWKLLYRTYKNDTLSNIVQLTNDIMADNISPALSNYGITWLRNDKLIFQEMWLPPSTIDSLNCSNPQIYKYKDWYYPLIVYEKGTENHKQIYLAQYDFDINQGKTVLKIDLLSNGEHCINPSFGPLAGVSYQTKSDGIWKIVYPHHFSGEFYISENRTCNYENPIMFRFPIPTRGHNEEVTDFFVAFDTDSFDVNREIMINIKKWPSGDSLINISNSPADDKNPFVTVLNTHDSCKVGIIWEREQGGKTDIWWAKAPFKLIYGNVTDRKNTSQTFALRQNYPNPFNSKTIISYELGKSAFVNLSIYNVNGQVIETLVNGYVKSGVHSIEWTANNVSSGLYFYKISSGNIIKIKKCLLIK